MKQIGLLKPEEAAKKASSRVNFFRQEQEKLSLRSKLSEGARKGLDMALFEIVQTGTDAEVERLLKAGANINFRDERESGMTPLILAAFRCRYKLVEKILEWGAEVDVKRERGVGDTALIMAGCCSGDKKDPDANALKTVRILLQHGADVNAIDEEGLTPLISACGWEDGGGDIDVVRILLSAGADVNLRKEAQDTALTYAVLQGYEGIARLLIDNGADVNAIVNRGETILMAAATGIHDGDHIEIVKLLIESGADVNAMDDEGKTVLMHAVEEDREEMVEFLKKHGAKM